MLVSLFQNSVTFLFRWQCHKQIQILTKSVGFPAYRAMATNTSKVINNNNTESASSKHIYNIRVYIVAAVYGGFVLIICFALWLSQWIETRRNDRIIAEQNARPPLEDAQNADVVPNGDVVQRFLPVHEPDE